MKQTFVKAREFLILWFAYFIFMAVLAVLAIYLISPLIFFAKTGEFQLVSSIQPLVNVGRGVVAGSFALTIVMFVWEHFRQTRDR